MKKYALILLVLIVIGLGLSVRLLTQEQRLDQTVFLQTTESIRNLQALDKNFSLLLNKSRYNSTFQNSDLGDTNYELSEEFDNLRFDALFEEIEASPELSAAVAQFEEQFVSREETLDAYIIRNTMIANALLQISKATESLNAARLNDQAPKVLSLLGSTNAQIYQLAIGGQLSQATLERRSGGLLDRVSQMQFEAPADMANDLSAYKLAVEQIIENDPPSREQFVSLESLETGPLLDRIEDEYTNYHNQGIAGSNQFRNALIIYGLCLLSALLFFAVRIRQNYLSLEQQVADRTAEIETAYGELQESQEQLIQSEKMASLGQMVAGVAHEINTPLGYVSSNVDTLKLNLEELTELVSSLGEVLNTVKSKNRTNKQITEKLLIALKAYQSADAPELVIESNQLLSDGSYGLAEISKLVSGLKDFARLDRQSSEQFDINDCLRSSLTIASNHIRENNVTVVEQLTDLPKIACFPSKLNQLFLNVITNACQAMKSNGGTLVVSSQPLDDQIQIKITDQGIGMDAETQQKMFDPFFTSKDIGEGTGLGMSIAYKIVAAHKGKIDVESVPEQGTSIIISLPYQQ